MRFHCSVLSCVPTGFPFADDEPCLGVAVLLSLQALRNVAKGAFVFLGDDFFQRCDSTLWIAVCAFI